MKERQIRRLARQRLKAGDDVDTTIAAVLDVMGDRTGDEIERVASPLLDALFSVVSFPGENIAQLVQTHYLDDLADAVGGALAKLDKARVRRIVEEVAARVGVDDTDPEDPETGAARARFREALAAHAAVRSRLNSPGMPALPFRSPK